MANDMSLSSIETVERFGDRFATDSNGRPHVGGGEPIERLIALKRLAAASFVAVPEEGLEAETWASYPDAPNDYLVSTCGRVFGLRTGTVLRPSTTTGNKGERRRMYGLRIDGVMTRRYASSMALETFVCRRPGSPKCWHADHIDGDHTNDCLDNLRWLPASENLAQGSKRRAAKKAASRAQ